MSNSISLTSQVKSVSLLIYVIKTVKVAIYENDERKIFKLLISKFSRMFTKYATYTNSLSRPEPHTSKPSLVIPKHRFAKFYASRNYNTRGIFLVFQSVIKSFINPQAPVAQKVADKVVFRRFQGEGVEFFFNRTSLTPPPQIFDAHLLENINFSPSSSHFLVGF